MHCQPKFAPNLKQAYEREQHLVIIGLREVAFMLFNASLLLIMSRGTLAIV